MSSTFDYEYIDAQIIGSWYKTSVQCHIPLLIGDIVQACDIDGVAYDTAIEMISNPIEDCSLPTLVYLKILRVNETFYDYVQQQYRKYKD